MQEKWVYDKTTFDSFAKHWKTGQPVPQWMYEQIKGSITYRKGVTLMWGIVFMPFTSALLLNLCCPPLRSH